jgi:hypothetical protein
VTKFTASSRGAKRAKSISMLEPLANTLLIVEDDERANRRHGEITSSITEI